MRTRSPISEARRAESRRSDARRAEIRRTEQLRVEGIRASQLEANRRRGIRLAATPGAVVGVVSLAATWAAASLIPGLVVGAVLGTVVGTGSWALAAPLALRLTGATPAGALLQPRAHNLLDGLCPSAGVPRPELWVLDNADILNAMMIATNPARARLVVTSALLSALTRVELEAVLAHELMHLRSGDAVPATLAVSTGWALLATTPASDREEAADLGAVSLIRYPRALAAALERMTDDIPVSGIAAKLTRHMWLASTSAPPTPRAAALREL